MEVPAPVGKGGAECQSPGAVPRLPRSPRLGHRELTALEGVLERVGSGGEEDPLHGEPQSLNAAYATSGPMYLSDHENMGSSTKSTTALGRSGGRLPLRRADDRYGRSPNIASSGVASDTIAFGSTLLSEHGLHRSSLLRQARDNTIMDLQTQLKEVLRKSDLLRKDVEVKSKVKFLDEQYQDLLDPELKKEAEP